MIKREVIQKLKTIVGKENLIQSKVALAAYTFDSSLYKGSPGVVVFPTTTDMIVQIIKTAKADNLPVLARGAGTSLSGGAIAPENAIVIVLTKMNKILEINPRAGYAFLEVGATNKALQLALEPYGLMFAPDPGSQNVSTIGGNVAVNAGGMRGVKYGSTKDNLLGLEVVLSSGEVITTGSLLSDLTQEIDLSYLFCGSEGTLGVITKAWVKLSPIPEDIITLTASFNSLAKAGSCVADIIAQGIIPTAMEIMDKTVILALEEYMQMGLDLEAEALLLVEVDGFRTEVHSQGQKIMAAILNNQGSHCKIAQNKTEREELWRARRAVNGALGKLRSAMLVHDIVVPRDKLAFMLGKVSEIAKKYNILIGQVAHAGDGNIHPSLLYDHRHQEEFDRVAQAGDEIIKEAIAQGGVITGEHGIGLEKLKYMPLAFEKDTLALMLAIREAIDPKLLFNPDKLLTREVLEGGEDFGQ